MFRQKYFLLLIFLTINHFAYAQFAIIIDKDGFVNVREKATIKSKVKAKINSNEIVYIFYDEEFGDWRIVDYTNTESPTEIITGYVHKSRIKFIDTYKKISNYKF